MKWNSIKKSPGNDREVLLWVKTPMALFYPNCDANSPEAYGIAIGCKFKGKWHVNTGDDHVITNGVLMWHELPAHPKP